MDRIEEQLRTMGATFAQDFVSRFARAPLALSTEALARFTLKQQSDVLGGSNDRHTERARAMVQRAAAAKAMQLGEFHASGWTCGYFKNADGLAIIPVWGDVGPARAFWPWVWYEDLADAAQNAAKDGDVKAILLHVDSPGGYVTGLADCCAVVEQAAAAKPMAAFANDYATSAAYWLAAAAGRISAPPSGIVGSIGTICIHDEASRALDNMGVKITMVRSDSRKAEANFFEPLTPQALQALQHEVALCADEFKGNVARLRQIDRVQIDATQAACITMDQATASRFADAIETFDQACAGVLARAAAAVTAAATPPAAPGPGAAPGAPTAKARPPAKAAKPSTKSRAGESAKPKPAARAQSSRSSNMDPTAVPIEEQIARRDEIAAIVAEEPADDAAASGQYQQIAEIVMRPAEGSEEEAAPAEGEGEGEAAPAEARSDKWRAAQARAITSSKEAKTHPQLAVAAISSGMSLAQFKASCAAAPKGNGFTDRMSRTQTAESLGNGGGDARGNGGKGKVVQMPIAGDVYKTRREQARNAGKRTG